MVKNFLKKLHEKVLLELNYFYDLKKYKNFYTNTSKKAKTKQELQSWILQDKHRIEKAISLPNPRQGFGKEVFERLTKNTLEYIKQTDKDEIFYISLGVFNAYKEFHYKNNYTLPDFYINLRNKFAEEDFNNKKCNQSGYYESSYSDISLNNSLQKAMRSRKSCRNFDEKKIITPEVINEIMSLAITAPSVCNRQHWKVHFFTQDNKNKILSFQNGNSGFTKNIPMIAVVTSELSAFYSPNERNQPYTDGGIFSMNLMYAIESVGLKSCPLNWCNSYRTEKKFSKLNLIPQSEKIILIIAFGYPNQEYIIAKSPRLPVNNFYTLN
ncbi:nitroreductase family protein [Providencia sp. PROV114]|uniref:nitroreductase family protein n=1 Tax=Providencia sp. PROV114 TaxID=2949825 RepID=UPI00234B2765|nr:nitroreductase family protein [Providencia sp. PROV114]WOB82035.1 nitroreductase family protein [Providencia sp. PROV114]